MVVVQVVNVRRTGREREDVFASDERVVLFLFLWRTMCLEEGLLQLAVHVLSGREVATELAGLLTR